MPNFANITLVGHLGRDPEIRQTAGGQSVTNIALATSRKRQGTETTTWWRGAVWGQRGEALAQYLGKGDPVLIVGEPYQREWTDQSGQTRLSMEVDVRDWAFVGGKGERQVAATPTPAPLPQRQAAPAQDYDDDVPF
jgi:single-strand DNA-binding protein